jgi:hypothetical protein
MSIKGRTITEHRHRRGGRLDPAVHGVTFYPTAPVPQTDEILTEHYALLPNRIGAAERDLELSVERKHRRREVRIALHGWVGYSDIVTLDERQTLFLRDTLNEWFPPE